MDSIAQRVKDLTNEFKHARRRLQEERQAWQESRQQLADATEAQHIVQHIAQTVQEKAHEKITSIVSRCLETVFDDPYEFKINFERKRGRTEAELVFIRNGHEVDPTAAAGQSTVDVASFALRVACLVLSQPQRRRLVVMDEPFKWLDVVYYPKIKAMLKALSKELDVQFIMVTRSSELKCGKVFDISES